MAGVGGACACVEIEASLGTGVWVEDEYGRGECRKEKEGNGKMQMFWLKRSIVCVNVDGIQGRYGGGGRGLGKSGKFGGNVKWWRRYGEVSVVVSK